MLVRATSVRCGKEEEEWGDQDTRVLVKAEPHSSSPSTMVILVIFAITVYAVS